MSDEEIIISVNFEHRMEGKRKKKKCPIDYRVRVEFWYDLIIFVLDDEFSTYTDEHLLTFRHKELDLFMKTNAMTYNEQKIYDEMKYAKIGSNIEFKQVFVQNSYPATVQRVNENTATYISKKGKAYEIALSDKVKYDGIKPKDEAVITILSNGNWVVSHISKVYNEEEERKETEKQIKEFEDLLGGY